jgi:glycosyltransferase involved in cell wall biosynthesis
MPRAHFPSRNAAAAFFQPAPRRTERTDTHTRMPNPTVSELPPAAAAKPVPLVSVGLPVYNGERYLEVAIRSVLSQTWTDLELVICDNGSSDRTEEICRRHAEADPRVRYHRNGQNIGASGNFRRVFELSKGRYFRWLCADDYIAATSIERCLAMLEAHPDVSVVCTKVQFVDETGNEFRPYDAVQALPQHDAAARFRSAFEQDPWCNSAYGLIRRETLARTALHQPFPASDKALIIELAIHSRFLEVDEPLFFRRIHPGAYSFAVSHERDVEFYRPGAAVRGKAAPMARAWPNSLAYLGAVKRSPARLGEKVRMYSHVLRQAWWQRTELLAEAGRWMRGALRT